MPSEPLKVLAIDDSNDTLATVKAVLQDALPGAILLTAQNGRAGLELAQTEDPVVILLDINTSDMDGFKLCQKLKEDARMRLIPVVLLTTLKPDRETLKQALAAGAEAILAKPLNEVEVAVQIRAMAKIKAANQMQHYKTEQLITLVAERTLELENSQGAALKLVQDLKAENEARAKSEEALRESEGKYHNLFEMVSDALFLIDNETGHILDANRTATILYGYSHAELLQLRNVDLSCQPAETQSATANKLIHIPHRLHRKKGGSIFPVEISATHFMYNGRQAHIPAIRDITERNQIEETMLFLVQSGWVASGEDFFCSLARFLAKNLEMDYVCIDRLEGDQKSALTVAVYFDGKLEENVAYTLKDTPCGDVVGNTTCVFPKHVRHLFPKDVVLQDMGAESYLGTTLWDSSKQPIGLIAVIGRRPLENEAVAKTILEMVAVRAAGELERRQAVELLRINEERFRQMYERSPLGYQSLDADGCFLDVNQTWLDTLGYPYDQVIGHWFGDFLVPEMVEAFRQRFPLFIAAGEVHNQFRMLHKDGRTLTVAFDGKIGYDENGRFKQTHCIINDITVRKKIEDALLESEKRLRLALQNAPLPIILHAENGEVLLVNHAWTDLSGYTLEDIPTITLWAQKAYGSSYQAVVSAIEQSYSLEKREDEGQFIIRTKDGRDITWEFSSSALGTLSDGRRLVISMATDVTERKQAETQIKEQLDELRRWYDAMLGREGRVLELKGEVNQLLEQMGQPIRYFSATEDIKS